MCCCSTWGMFANACKLSVFKFGPIEIYGKPTIWARAFKPLSRLEGQDGDNDSHDNDEDDHDSLDQRMNGDRISQAQVSRLFRTSRTVYRESALLYLRHNIFQFHEVDSVVSFISVLPPTCRRAISLSPHGINKSFKCMISECTKAFKTRRKRTKYMDESNS